MNETVKGIDFAFVNGGGKQIWKSPHDIIPGVEFLNRKRSLISGVHSVLKQFHCLSHFLHYHKQTKNDKNLVHSLEYL